MTYIVRASRLLTAEFEVEAENLEDAEELAEEQAQAMNDDEFGADITEVEVEEEEEE